MRIPNKLHLPIFIILQLIAGLVMINHLSKLTLILPFLVSTLGAIYVIIKQKSSVVTIFFIIIILLSYVLYFYLINNETFSY